MKCIKCNVNDCMTGRKICIECFKKTNKENTARRREKQENIISQYNNLQAKYVRYQILRLISEGKINPAEIIGLTENELNLLLQKHKNGSYKSFFDFINDSLDKKTESIEKK